MGLTPDDEGQELPDAAAARDIALSSIRSLIAAEAMEGRIDLRGRLEISDADGRQVLTIPFADAIELLTGDVP